MNNALRSLALFAIGALLFGCTLPSSGPTAVISIEALSAASFRFRAALGGAFYEWHFGDGTTSDQRIVEHTYDEPGEYTVNLSVADLDGDADFAHETVIAYRDITVATSWETDEPAPDYTSLQLAIDEAGPNDWILASGEFREDVWIDAPVQLRGPCTLVSETAESLMVVDEVEGVTIEQVTFEGGDIEGSVGSGLRVLYSTAVFAGCRFEALSAEVGGAVHVFESEADFIGCTFVGNEADGDGGAVYVQGDRIFPQFDACTFHSNRAATGGAISIRRADTDSTSARVFVARDCLFQDNRADGGPLGSDFVGGAIHIGLSVSAELIDNAYINNVPTDVFSE